MINDQDVERHIEMSLEKVRVMYKKAAARIQAIKPGDKIAATQLATDIAKEYNMTGPQLYPTLKFLFDDFPGRLVKKGAHGGIINPLPEAAPSDSETK